MNTYITDYLLISKENWDNRMFGYATCYGQDLESAIEDLFAISDEGDFPTEVEGEMVIGRTITLDADTFKPIRFDITLHGSIIDGDYVESDEVIINVNYDNIIADIET